MLITFLNKQDVKIKRYSLDFFVIKIKIIGLHDKLCRKTDGIQRMCTVSAQIKYITCIRFNF